MTDSHYNLLDEPWLPARLADGSVKPLGLLELFRRGGEVVALAETSPPSLVAEYRLLLAIVHRALVRSRGTWPDSQRGDWFRHGLPVDDICAYLEEWRDRFWLFDETHPFMQVAALAPCEETKELFPASTVSLEQFYGTEMFNQEVYLTEPWPASEVIRSLLGYLTFVPGGFFPGKKLKKSEKAGSLVNTAAVLPVGLALPHTLCLALHAAALPGQPFHDLPAWERPPLTLAQLRGEPVLASGPNDRYTRQSRAVLLTQETNGRVRWLRFAAGWALGEDPQAPDPMACYRAGTQGLVRVGFNEGRAVWRDLPALVPAPQEGYQAAAVVQAAARLRKALGAGGPAQALLVAGLASDQAKLLRWRLDQIALPQPLLVDPGRARELREHVALAEEIYKVLRNAATNLVAATLPDPGSKDTRNRARAILDAGPCSATYFAAAERELWPLMSRVADDDPDGAIALWHRALYVAAQQSWESLLAALGLSARALQAEAQYGPRLFGSLHKHLPQAMASSQTHSIPNQEA